MAKTVHVAGPVLVKVAFLSSLEELGYTRSGVDVRLEPHFLDVPGDEGGGEEGVPIEIEFLGETARIRLELTKYDDTVANKVHARVVGGTAGTPAAAGTLIFAGAKDMRVCLVGTNEPMNFPRCVPREPTELNKGSKFSTLVFEFVAYKDANGVLYNAVIT
ncbi:hypothetical protein [Trichococcus shcherbakoviae]|uniref:hypothetical protein n=1 Tax=Trichococcus shcherbakoviae TaxID=2094020 RepID=UPI002AA77253|nr:hypothetical protein [Trichococcus shcherbakoviae]